ncbi:MAG: hypothetical protein IT384_10085 [Deltaproteobacteria bacterium]|nr:hypothetical protein [Deltaproteobacteria bacterium]
MVARDRRPHPSAPGSTRAWAPIVVLAIAGCFGAEATVFPPGLEPLEENLVAPPDPQGGETITILTGEAPDHQWAHGRGLLRVSPEDAWRALKDPPVSSNSCDADTYDFDIQPDPAYELAYVAHYAVHSVITVQWDTQWRFGTVLGAPAEPELAIARYQKVYGSTAIDLIEGSFQLLAVDDAPELTEVQLVDHLSAFGAGVENIQEAMEYRFSVILAAVHGQATPSCPP